MQNQQLKNLYVYLDRLQWELERATSSQFLFGTPEGVREAYENVVGIQRSMVFTITELTKSIEYLLNLE